MLPRHLQSLVLRSSLRNRAVLSHHHLRNFPSRVSPILGAPRANFHASSRQLNEPPKSPFQTFVDVLKDELRKNRELQDNVKLLQGDVDKFQDSEAMKKARAAYERARVRHLITLFTISRSCCYRVAHLKHQRKSTVARSCRRAEEDRCQSRRRCRGSLEEHGRERDRPGSTYLPAALASQLKSTRYPEQRVPSPKR